MRRSGTAAEFPASRREPRFLPSFLRTIGWPANAFARQCRIQNTVLDSPRERRKMIDSSKEPVLVSEQRGHVLVLRLNRPEVRNALNAELIGALGTAFGEAEADPSTRAVVLSGTGDRAFCAGMDLRDFARGVTTSTRPEDMATFARFTRWELSVPVVGAATAAAVAGGFELLLGCDVVVASEKAVFGLPEVKRGLFAAGGCVFLGTRIP